MSPTSRTGDLSSAKRLMVICGFLTALAVGIGALFIQELERPRTETFKVTLPLSVTLKASYEHEEAKTEIRAGLAPAETLSPMLIPASAGALGTAAVAMPQFSPSRFGPALPPSLPRASNVALSTGAQAQMISKRIETFTALLKPGDTLMQMLIKAGANRTDANAAIKAMSKVKSPRHLRAGQPVHMLFLTSGHGEETSTGLIGMRIKASMVEEILIKRDPEGAYKAEKIEIELQRHTRRVKGTIRSSLFQSASKLGVPDRVTVNLAHILAYSIDFQSEIQEGDEFEIYYEELLDDAGRSVQPGNILYASMTNRGKTRNLYRFESGDHGTDYFDASGASVRKFLMRTPVDAARISSRFGKRFHPIHKRWKAHNGVDFAASRGTRIYAAGDGRISFAGKSNGYGNLVKIAHSNGYETRYAHMHRFGRGIRNGARVKQGQVIGYVGSTGWATGPHLHYEVRAKGRAVNPLSIKVPTGRTLAGTELAQFKRHVQSIEAQKIAAPLLVSTKTAMATMVR